MDLPFQPRSRHSLKCAPANAKCANKRWIREPVLARRGILLVSGSSRHSRQEFPMDPSGGAIVMPRQWSASWFTAPRHRSLGKSLSCARDFLFEERLIPSSCRSVAKPADPQVNARRPDGDFRALALLRASPQRATGFTRRPPAGIKGKVSGTECAEPHRPLRGHRRPHAIKAA